MPQLFETAADKAAYLSAYDAMLRKWPIPVLTGRVQTRLGSTHFIEAGTPAGPPLVLLPAVSVSATEWFANVEELGRSHRLFAIDIVGDAGRSVLEQQVVRSADYADWLAEVFAGLGLNRPAVAGHSYGGWLTLHLAAYRPDAVGPVIVLAPSSGLAPFHWYMKAFLRVAERLPFKPDAKRTLEMQAHKGFAVDPTFVRLMQAMTAHARTNVLFPTMLSDDELAAIRSPVLVLIGAQEMLYDGHRALERAMNLIVGAEGELIEGCGHLLIMEDPATIDRKIGAFLARVEGRAVLA